MRHLRSLPPLLLTTVLLVVLVFSPALNAAVVDDPLTPAQKDSLRKLIREWTIKATENRTNVDILNRVCGLYFELGKIDSAEIWVNLAKQAKEKNFESHYWQGRIFLHKGKSSIIPLEGVMSLIKQDNHSRAVRQFRDAIKLRPDFYDAHFFLGETYLSKGGKESFENAITTYLGLLELNPEYPDVKYELSIAYYRLKNYPMAIQYLNMHSSDNPRDSRPFIQMSNIEMELGNTEKASRLFMEGVMRLRDTKMLGELFLEIEDISSSEEKEEYHSLPLQQKGLFFKKFWKRRDPTPFTEENQRYTEHFRRVMHARLVFSYTAPPFYDDRGRVYVKYGKPDLRYQSTMATSGIKDNESWSYEKSVRRGLVFDFVQFGAHYSLVQDLSLALQPGMPHDARASNVAQMYLERAPSLGGAYNRFSIDFKETDLMEYSNEKMQARKNAPPETFRYDYDAVPLPHQVRFAQFRGPDGSTRLEIYHSVFGNNLGVSHEGNQYIASVNSTIGVFDQYYNEVDRKSRETKLVGDTENQIREIANIDEAVFLLPPSRSFNVVLKVENPEGQMLGISRIRADIRQFAPDSLQISSLELASRVEQAQKKGRFYKDGLWVLPYTFSRLDRKNPTTIYYEVYNLAQNADGQTDYAVDYQVASLSRKEGGLKKFFRAIGSVFGAGKKESVTSSYSRQGTSSDEKEYISLDIGKMPVGVIELSVTITDRISLQKKKSTIRLEII